jgi:hypothetical protein
MRRAVLIATAAIVLAISAMGIARAVAPASSTNQHFYTTAHTNFGGFADVDLQVPVDVDNVVIKVASGGTNLGGEDPSFATVNFAGFLDANTIRVRIIGWHAVASGQAEFRYYSNKDARIAVDVYERTVPAIPLSSN